MTILCLTRSRAWFSRFLNTWAAARPNFKAISAVTGSTLAVPRTPSVPKIFFGVLIISTLANFLTDSQGWNVRSERPKATLAQGSLREAYRLEPHWTRRAELPHTGDSQ